MKGKTKKIVLAVAVIGAIAAGGAAFTAANTVPDSVAGYGTTTVSRRDATRRLSTRCRLMARHHVDRRSPLTGDHGRHVVKAGFGTATPRTRLRRRTSATHGRPAAA